MSALLCWSPRPPCFAPPLPFTLRTRMPLLPRRPTRSPNRAHHVALSSKQPPPHAPPSATTVHNREIILLPRRLPRMQLTSPAFLAELHRLEVMASHGAAGVPSNAIAGIDEVGVGALAGPLVAAAVVLPASPLFEGLDDSKRVPPARRAAIAAALRSVPGVRVGLGVVEAAELDAIGVRAARVRAMEAALAELAGKGGGAVRRVLVDGDLGVEARAGVGRDGVVCVVGGDGLCASVAAASVVAKVARDAMMAEEGGRWGGYGFERNAGYGTREHCEAIARHGVCPSHRRSYRPVREAVERGAEGDAVDEGRGGV